MTDYSNNDLIVIGLADEALKFKSLAKGPTSDMDFSKFTSPPEKFKSDSFDSHEWHYKHWGTKWNAREVKVKEERKGKEIWLTYTFDTAAGVPEPIIRKMARMFPKLEFILTYYVEWGSGGGRLHLNSKSKPVKVKKHLRKGRGVRQHRRRK
jgi:hypothetical protein